MIRYLLQEIEKSPHALFSKRELCSLSQTDYEYLIRKKILAYFRPAESDLERTTRRCQHGCPLTIIQDEHGIEGICLEHPEEDPIAIEKDERYRYSFSLPTFLELIRAANQWEGRLHLIDGDILYMGYIIYDRQRVGIVYMPNVGRDILSQLLGTKKLCGEDEYLVIVNPFTKVEEVSLRTNLHQNKILQLSLADCLNTQTFELNLETNLAGMIRRIDDKDINAKNEFNLRFSEGQVFHKGKDIGIPTGRPQEILKKIVDRYPEVAKYHFLDGEDREVTSVSDQLKKDINVINGILKAKQIPLVIRNKRSTGYYIIAI